MKRPHLISQVILMIWMILSMVLAHAGTPLWTFTPLTPTTLTVATNQTATIQYEVTNQSKTTHTLLMRAIPGVTQVTTSGNCPSPFVLGYKQSCTLNLSIHGSELIGNIDDGPIVCQTGNVNQCYRPGSSDTLKVIKAVNSPITLTAIPSTYAVVGLMYSQGNVASGGTPPYVYSLLSGTLPVGTTLDPSTGTVSGIPTTAIPFSYIIKGTDIYGATATANSSGTILALLASVLPNDLNVDVGQAATFTANPTGGTAPYAYQWYSCIDAACLLPTTLIVGATSSTYNPSTAASGTHYYRAILTDATAATATTNSATLTVNMTLSASVTPGSLTVDEGEMASFTATPTGGTAAYSYQWYSCTTAGCGSTTLIVGATSATYSPSTAIPGVSYYQAVVADATTATATTNSASLTVSSALSATVIPVSMVVDAGQIAAFTANPTGGVAPYAYQWYSCIDSACLLPPTLIVGATSSSYNPSTASPGVYYYQAMVTDATASTATTNSATLTVNSSLSATVVPGSLIVDVGQAATFNVSPTGGTPAYNYQWYSCTTAGCGSTTLIVGATSSTYSPSTASQGVYYYQAIVTDATAATVTTNSATLTVNNNLSATVAPVSLDVNAGQTATFTASPTGGTAAYGYQWYSCTTAGCGSTTLIVGATSSTYSPSTAIPGVYYYQAIVTDATAATATTNSATLTVNASLSATVAPGSLTVDSGQTATFTASPTGGTAAYSYQWYSCTTAGCGSTTLIVGATSSTYSPSTASPGVYYYRALVTDATAATATTNSASLSVNAVLSATVAPGSSIVDTGQTATFTATPTGGTAAYSYQWYSCTTAGCGSTTLIVGATSSTYSPSTASPGVYYYQAIVTDATAATATTNSTTLTVNAALSASVTPGSLTVDSGQVATFTATPTGGTAAYSYQWYSCTTAGCGSTTLIVGATSSTYSPSTASPGVYYYRAIITDATTATATTNSTTLTVNAVLSATATPGGLTVDSGQAATFTATPTGGTAAYSYQWYSCTTAGCGSTTLIVGATSSTYSPSTASPGVYYYQAIVSDATAATVTTNSATLTVNAALSASVTPGNLTVDSGQTATLTATPTGGTAAYSYKWYSCTTAGCGSTTLIVGATSSTYSPSTAIPGVYYYQAIVTDATTATATTNSATLTINAALSASATPGSLTVDAGQTATFTATPTGGTAAYSYQWYSCTTAGCGSTTLIVGATSSTYSPSTAIPGVYYYQALVTDATAATATTNSTTLTVNAALSASVTPGNLTVDSGQVATFTATPTGGTAAYSYQWYSCTTAGCGSTTLIVGATSSTYSPSTASPGVYYYQAIVTDATAATATTNSATLAVNNSLSATVAPGSIGVAAGQVATFTATPFGGTAPYSYQWYSCTTAGCGSTSLIVGATSSTYNPSTAASGTYYYQAIVTDTTTATATTNSATLVVVGNAVSASVTPGGITVDVGQVATFTATPTGGFVPYSYQWYSCTTVGCGSTTLIVGATSSTYSPSTAIPGVYYYHAIVTDAATATATTNSATLTVNATLSATVAPGNVMVDAGQTATFTASPAGGTAAYSYQWYSCTTAGCGSTTLIVGATSSTYSPSTASPGVYYYHAIVTDATAATATTNSATLTINAALSASVTPGSLSVDIGQTATFTANPTGGTVAYSYQWYSCTTAGCGSTTLIVGATSSTYSPSTASQGVYYYQTIVTDATGASATSNAATLTVNPVLSISSQPLNQTIAAGSTATFTVTASGGTSPYTYQWQVSTNGGVSFTNVSTGTGGTTLSYTTAALAGSDSGNQYRVIVTDAASASVTSSSATLTVTLTVTPSGDTHETYSPSTPQTVNSGATQAFTGVTANTGYTLNAVGGTCSGSLVGSTYTTGAITSSCSVIFSATIQSFLVTPSGDGHESISPNTAQLVNYGSTQSFTVTANTGYTLSNTVGGSCPAGSWVGSTYTTGAIIGACNVTFSSTINTYTVTPSGDGNESINPNTPQSVNYNLTTSFTVTANASYTLSSTVGGTCPAGSWVSNTYTTGAITSSCSVTFSASASGFTIGGTISGLTASGLVLQNNGGDNLTVSSGATTFQFATPIASGGNYSVTIAKSPIGLACFLTNSSGTAVANVTTVNIACKAPFAYVSDDNSASISLCTTINSSTGVLSGCSVGGVTSVGSPAVAVDPAGKFLYTADISTNRVSLFAIDQVTGAITPTPGGTATGSGFSSPAWITLNPAGTLAYVANYGNNRISKCTVNSGTGVLSGCTTTGMGTGFNGPLSVALNPAGTFAYVSNNGLTTVRVCAVSSTTGLFSGCTSYAVIGAFPPGGVTIDSTNTFAYVTDPTNSLVYVCSINSGTGGISGCSSTTGGGLFNNAYSVTLKGGLAYVSNYGVASNDIIICAVNSSTGALSSCASSTDLTFSWPYNVAFTGN